MSRYSVNYVWKRGLIALHEFVHTTLAGKRALDLLCASLLFIWNCLRSLYAREWSVKLYYKIYLAKQGTLFTPQKWPDHRTINSSFASFNSVCPSSQPCLPQSGTLSIFVAHFIFHETNEHRQRQHNRSPQASSKTRSRISPPVNTPQHCAICTSVNHVGDNEFNGAQRRSRGRIL